MLLICLGRAAFVFPLSALSNHMNRNAGTSSSTITFKHQVSSQKSVLCPFLPTRTISYISFDGSLFYIGSNMVGWSYERGSLYCFGVQTGLFFPLFLPISVNGFSTSKGSEVAKYSHFLGKCANAAKYCYWCHAVYILRCYIGSN